MNRYVPLIKELLLTIEKVQSEEPKDDNEVLFLLGAKKLENAILAESINFMGKHSSNGNPVNIDLIEKLVMIRDSNSDIIKEIKNARIPKS